MGKYSLANEIEMAFSGLFPLDYGQILCTALDGKNGNKLQLYKLREVGEQCILPRNGRPAIP